MKTDLILQPDLMLRPKRTGVRLVASVMHSPPGEPVSIVSMLFLFRSTNTTCLKHQGQRSRSRCDTPGVSGSAILSRVVDDPLRNDVD